MCFSFGPEIGQEGSCEGTKRRVAGDIKHSEDKADAAFADLEVRLWAHRSAETMVSKGETAFGRSGFHRASVCKGSVYLAMRRKSEQAHCSAGATCR